MFLPTGKSCLSKSQSLVIWPSSVIFLYGKAVWDNAVRHSPLPILVICVGLTFALLLSLGFARIFWTFVPIKAVRLDYDLPCFDYQHLDDLLMELQMSTEVDSCLYEFKKNIFSQSWEFYILFFNWKNSQCFEYDESSRNFFMKIELI